MLRALNLLSHGGENPQHVACWPQHCPRTAAFAQRLSVAWSPGKPRVCGCHPPLRMFPSLTCSTHTGLQGASVPWAHSLAPQSLCLHRSLCPENPPCSSLRASSLASFQSRPVGANPKYNMHFQDLPHPPPNGPWARHSGLTPKRGGCRGSDPQLASPKGPQHVAVPSSLGKVNQQGIHESRRMLGQESKKQNSAHD